MEAIKLTPPPGEKVSKEAYFEQLRQSPHKLEYIDGWVRMMAGGTRAHNQLIRNLSRACLQNPGGCETFLSDTALSISDLNRYYFPDLMVVCDTPATFEPGKLEKLNNPCLIVEVLSDSTSEYDRAEKFSAYRQLPSFREYILIDSRKLAVDTYYRESDQLWHIRSHYREEQLLHIRSLDLEIPLADLYANVELPPPPPPAGYPST